MRLSTRMMIYVLTTSVVVFITGIGYISYRYKTKAANDAKSITDAYARLYANYIKSELDKDFGVSRGMAQAMLAIEDSEAKNKQDLHIETMKNVLYSTKGYIAAFLQWDLSDCQPGYTKNHGRRRYFAYREFSLPELTGQVNLENLGEVKVLAGLVDTASYNPNNAYYIVKENLTEYIINPYFYTYDNIEAMPTEQPETENSILETTLIVPLVTNGKFRALTGVDIPLNHFNDIIKNIRPFEKSYAFIVANNGVLVAHPNRKLIGDSLSWYLDEHIDKKYILKQIKNGHPFSFFQNIEDEGLMYYSIAPIHIGYTKTPWAIGVRVPMEVIMAEANKHFYTSFLVGLLGLLLLSLIIWQISLNITRPIKSATELFKNLAQGRINDSSKLFVKTRDEIAGMADSANKLLDGFKQTSDFANKIGSGNLDASYTLLSNEDVLGKSLIEMRDNLKQSKQEIELKNKELEKLSTVAQNTDNAVMILANDGKIEWVNEAFTKMYGYNLDELFELAENLAQISNYPKIKDLITACVKNKNAVYYNSMITSKFGEKVYAQTTISPVIDDDGEVNRLVAIDSNITEIKQAQEEIKAQRDQLKNQRNQLQELNATKDKFFSILAHDLKNPFSSLHSMSEMLTESFNQLDEEDKFQLSQKISQNASHIYDLLDDLLTWSRLQRGLVDYNPIEFNLAQLIDINLNINRLAAEKKLIKISANYPNDLTAVADRDMINTVIRNLVNNAVKFTEKGGTIEVKAQKSNGTIQVSVIDNGLGISKEDQEKLFRIDIKTKSIGKSKEKGTGLGLILCKEFVEKNGGKIWVESLENKGSQFHFTLNG
jgi:PAS domain S-box-containing protein